MLKILCWHNLPGPTSNAAMGSGIAMCNALTKDSGELATMEVNKDAQRK